MMNNVVTWRMAKLKMTKKAFIQESERQERVKLEGIERKARSAERRAEQEDIILTVPGPKLRDYEEIGWTWEKWFNYFDSLNVDRLLLIESYSRILNVPHLK